MFDDKDLEHLEDLVDQARSKLAKTAGYLPEDISQSLQDLLNHVDEFHDEILGAAADDARWLRARALDPSRVDDNGLARALPDDVTLPRWARFQRRPWPERGYRCVLPMFDEAGMLRSLRVRCVNDQSGPKALPPTGHRVGGLVMADTLGRALLAKGRDSQASLLMSPVRSSLHRAGARRPQGVPDHRAVSAERAVGVSLSESLCNRA